MSLASMTTRPRSRARSWAGRDDGRSVVLPLAERDRRRTDAREGVPVVKLLDGELWRLEVPCAIVATVPTSWGPVKAVRYSFDRDNAEESATLADAYEDFAAAFREGRGDCDKITALLRLAAWSLGLSYHVSRAEAMTLIANPDAEVVAQAEVIDALGQALIGGPAQAFLKLSKSLGWDTPAGDAG